MKGMKSIWLFVALIVAMAIVGCGKSSNANSQSIVEKPLVKTELAKIADRSGVMGYIDKTGRIVITDIHTINGVEEVMSFSKVDGTAAVLKKKDPSSKNRVWMFIDKEGKNILEPSIESLKTLHSFSCERALFNEIVITGFDRIKGFAENGLAAASYIDKKAMSPKWGFIDSQGNWCIKPVYDDAGVFSVNGLAPVKIGDFWGYIDTTGNMVIEPQFRAACEFVVFQ